MSRYLDKTNQVRIAYTVDGEGDALILLHGFGTSKEIFHQYQWVRHLKKHYRVIAIDLRGHGESSISHDADFYRLENLLEDIRDILHQEGYQECMMMGHSFGGSVALRGVIRGLPITKVVTASGTWDQDFFQKEIPDWIQEYELVQKKKVAKDWDGLPPEELDWIKESDLENYLAQFRAWTLFPEVEAAQIGIPVFAYTGTKDDPGAVEFLRNREAEFARNNWWSIVYPELNHRELVQREDLIIGDVIAFLQK